MSDDLFDYTRKPVTDNNEIKFLYDRDRRLESANEEIKKLHDNSMFKQHGLFKSLVATKSSAMLLFTIILLVLAMLFINKVSPDNIGKIEPLHFKLTLAPSNEGLFAEVKCNNQAVGEELNKEIFLVLAAYNSKNELLDQRQFHTIMITDTITFSQVFSYYNIAYVKATISVDGKTIGLRVNQ